MVDRDAEHDRRGEAVEDDSGGRGEADVGDRRVDGGVDAAVLAAAVDASSDAVVGLDGDGRVLAWTADAERLFGWTAEAVDGRRLPTLPDARDARDGEGTDGADGDDARVVGRQGPDTRDAPELSGAADGVTDAQVRRRTRAGEVIPVELSVRPVRGSAGGIETVCVYRDVREREALRDEFLAYRRRLDGAMFAGGLAWWEMDVETGGVRFHEQKADVLGFSPERFRTYEDFVELVHPDDYDRMMATMEAHLEGQADRYDVDYRIRTADGEYRWFHDVGGITEQTDDGPPGKVTGIVVDVTRQKRQEVELHRRADQLAVLNRIVRHDIRNDMNVAGGWLDVLRGEVPPDVRDRFDRVAGTIDDVVELTETVGDALEVIEGETPAADRAVDLGTVVEREAEKARARYDHATIETPAPTPEATVRASELFASVVRNLLNNAVQHGDESSPHVAVTIEERAGTVVLRVVDDGPGVPDDRKDDVFGRGEQGLDSEGTGVGLYLVDRLVDAYGGTVRVEDAEPTGAAFVVELERAGEA